MFNDDLYTYAENKNITIDKRQIPKNKSFSVHIYGQDFIAIDEKSMENSAEERTHLAHELGHCETGAFYAIDSSMVQRDKAEAKATRWAVRRLIPKEEFEQLLKKGYEKWDVAEYYNVTEQFIETAYHLYFESGMSA
jgi:Zn-dependent peptidase ImmA (M78 family)